MLVNKAKRLARFIRKTVTVSLFQTLYVGLDVSSNTTEAVKIPARRIGAANLHVNCQYNPKRNKTTLVIIKQVECKAN